MTETEIQLRSSVREAAREHVPAQHLDEVVDLAFHALNSAFAPLGVIAKSASAAVCVTSVALSMIAAEAQAKLAALEKWAASTGGYTATTTVNVGGANG